MVMLGQVSQVDCYILKSFQTIERRDRLDCFQMGDDDKVDHRLAGNSSLL